MGNAASSKQKQAPGPGSVRGEKTCPLPGKGMASKAPPVHSCRGDAPEPQGRTMSTPLMRTQGQSHTWKRTEFFGGSSPLMKAQGQSVRRENRCPPPGKGMITKSPHMQEGHSDANSSPEPGGSSLLMKTHGQYGQSVRRENRCPPPGKGMIAKFPPIEEVHCDANSSPEPGGISQLMGIQRESVRHENTYLPPGKGMIMKTRQQLGKAHASHFLSVVPEQGVVRSAVGRGAKPWGEKPPTPQELTGAECTPRGVDEVTKNKENGRHADAARRKLKEQEDLYIEQQTAQQYKAHETERQRKERQERESIMLMLDQQIKLQQMAEEYLQSEAKQQRKNMAIREKARTLEDEEDLDMFDTSMPIQALTPIHKMALQTHQGHQSAPRAGAASSSKPAEARGSRVTGGRVVGASATDARKGKEKEGEKDMVALATEFSPDSGEQKDRDEVSCIVTGCLYLTNFRGVENAGNLEALNIKHIVCVNEQRNTHDGKFNYFNIDTLEDQDDHDASVHFERVREFVDKALSTGGGVVFHCAAGISRSSTMLIAYLMAARRISLFEAFQMAYSRRRVVWPNRAFTQQLIEYECKLQKDGWLIGKTPSLTIQTWDVWTAGEGEVGRAKLVKQASDKSLDQHLSRHFSRYVGVAVAANYFRLAMVSGHSDDGKQNQATCLMGEA